MMQLEDYFDAALEDSGSHWCTRDFAEVWTGEVERGNGIGDVSAVVTATERWVIEYVERFESKR